MISKKVPKLYLLFLILLSFACSKTEENVPLTRAVDVIDTNQFVRKASLVNQTIPFKVINDAGEDVTDASTIFINGEPIFGSSFSSDVIGDFEAYAEYIENGFEVTTDTETFSVIIPKRKIVVEDYTGTWCGFCPRVSAALYSLKEETDDITVIAIHETANSFPDPMHFPQVQILKDAFNVEGFPAARINRATDWANPHPNAEITSIAGLDTNLALSINSELNGNELKVQVNVVYEEGSEVGDKLVVYLLEDGILYDQINYYDQDATSPYFNAGEIIPDFEHNETLRNSLTTVLGDPIEATPALTEYIATFTMTVPANYVVENLNIAAMVVDSDNNAKNSQHAPVNVNKPYE